MLDTNGETPRQTKGKQMTTTNTHRNDRRNATAIRCERVVTVTVPTNGNAVTVISKSALGYTTRTYYAKTQAHAKRISNAVIATLGNGNAVSATLALSLARLPYSERTADTY